MNLKRALQFGTLIELISRLYLLSTIFLELKKNFWVCCQFPLKRPFLFSPELKQNLLFKWKIVELCFHNLNSLSCTFQVESAESSNELIHKYNCICFILTNHDFIVSILLKISVNQIFNSNIFKTNYKNSFIYKTNTENSHFLIIFPWVVNPHISRGLWNSKVSGSVWVRERIKHEKVFEISVLLWVYWFSSQIQPYNSKQLFSIFFRKFCLFSKYVKLSKEGDLSPSWR